MNNNNTLMLSFKRIKKRSLRKMTMFFNLSYWSSFNVRHYFDMMHAKKICVIVQLEHFSTFKAMQKNGKNSSLDIV